MADAGDFLYSFGEVLQQQFNLGDNKLNTLDVSENGHNKRYGKLGDFANQFDQSAWRSYTEEGSFRNDPFNPKPKEYDLIMQDPDISVFVKKRAFASLAENFRPDLMDEQELLFYKTTKVLFSNKCKQIGNFEKLAKLSKIATDVGRLDTYLLPALFTLTDNITFLPSQLGFGPAKSLTKFASIVDRVREIVNLSSDNFNTTWITNLQNSFQSTQGEGTGVIELTNIMALNTTTSIKFAQGRFSLNISDPYKLMLITNNDIEQAISDSTNAFYNNSFFQLGVSSLNDTISLNKQQLNILRSSRRVNPIQFIIQPDTVFGQTIVVIVENIGEQLKFTGSVTSVSIDPSAFQGSNLLGNEGLNADEAGLFIDIIKELYTQISLSANTRRQANAFNQDPKIVNLRKKLRLHYGNKLIIQPMDNVHIYIRSKKRIDDQIVGGLQDSFNGAEFMQTVNNNVASIEDAFGLNENYSLEKALFVGDDFPSWLWTILRSWFVSEKDGAHVFAGIVDEATSSFNGGFFNASITGSDNAGYFKYGIVNIKPSLDVYNGPLFDPMTPFDIKFDSVTGFQDTDTPTLLQENVQLLTSVFIRNKNGPLAGIPPTQTSYFTTDAERMQNTNVRRVFYDPDGMVYRWKEGIGTLSTQGGTDPTTANQAAPSLTNDPFAGQDVMNVLSLLITGEPYSYATFYKAAITMQGYSRDPVTGEDASNSYFRSLQNNLKYRNTLYGNFVPFKSLTIDDNSYAKILTQINVKALDGELQSLLQKRASLADKLIFLQNASDIASTQSQAHILAGIDLQIQQKSTDINKELLKIDRPVSVVGDDISFDTSPINSGSKTRLDSNYRKELRRKIAFLTRRLSWKVRANEDQNFLIVDDTYDKDFDIQAFEKAFVNPELFKSEYITVEGQIATVASKLELEVFCNTQGHIEIRNPKYNKMPSSVFNKMFRMNDELGIKVFPQFLEDLYVDQLSSAVQQIEILEDEIRLQCLSLGKANDIDCYGLIGTAEDVSITSHISFVFLSEELTGKISGFDYSKINILANPEQILATIPTVLNPAIQSQLSVSAFSIARRASIIQGIFIPPGSPNTPNQFANIKQILDQQNAQDRKTKIIDRLRDKSSQTFDINQLPNKSTNSISSSDVLQILNNIAALLSQRQAVMKTAANASKNVKETIFASQDGSGSNKGIASAMFRSKSIPQAFEHMIEDESYDDLGPGSGKRFVLKNHDIISYSLSERRPPFTSVKVKGTFGDFLLGQDQIASLNLFQEGNSITTSTAVDYDLWRMYGVALPQDVDSPALTDPETQTPIYATSLLNRAKKQIISGTIDVIGNEFQQPGEVVYIEDRDMLFYIESVSHNFSYGRSFTTSLSVGYGHNAGEYIPTPLDIIGKIFYKNKDIVNFAHKRQGNVFNQEHIGTIVGNVNLINSISTNSTDSDIINGPYGMANRATLQQIINYAGKTLGLKSQSFNPVLELRIFYNSFSDFSTPSSYATDLVNSVNGYLIGANSLTGNTQSFGNTNNISQSLSDFGPNKTNQIQISKINTSITSVGEFRYPSTKAYHYARDAVKKASGLQDPSVQTKIDNVIYNYIVDCWIVYNNPTNSNTK